MYTVYSEQGIRIWDKTDNNNKSTRSYFSLKKCRDILKFFKILVQQKCQFNGSDANIVN